MEFTLCYWFWSFRTIVLAFFIFLIGVPVTILLISHLILTTSIPLLFSWTIFFTIKIIAIFIWSRLFFTACIYLSRCSCNSWFCKILNTWLLHWSFHFWSFHSLPTLLTLLFFFGYLLFKAIFTTTSILSILFSFQSCCTRFEVHFW